VPESAAVNLSDRSDGISAEVTIDAPEAGCAVFAYGASFGGHALCIKAGKVEYVYIQVGERRVGGQGRVPAQSRSYIASDATGSSPQPAGGRRAGTVVAG
jgi:hypothetical protein